MSELPNITSGSKRVIKTGTVISYGDAPVKLDFGKIPEHSELADDFSIEFLFPTDDSKKTYLKMEDGENNLVKINIFNHDSNPEGGNSTPISFTSEKGGKIELNFWIRKIRNSRTITYTLYQ